HPLTCLLFSFNDTATTAIYTLSLHDALPIFAIGENADQFSVFCDRHAGNLVLAHHFERVRDFGVRGHGDGIDDHAALRALYLVEDRKSTRLNSSHVAISYAVFCLKKKTIWRR